jgi:signal transduction histidine kinase
MIMNKPIHFLKQFEVWVTDLTDRYRYSPFFKATVHIFAIQLILAVLLIAITGFAIQYAQTNTVGSINHHIQLAQQGATSSLQALPAAIERVRSRTLLYVFICLILLIILFGVLLNRFALSPAKDSLRLQKRFIGNVAHEIRTPLAIIKTSTEVALMSPDLSESQQETLQDTLIELNRISETINNLLSFDALLQPSRMKIESVDIGKIAEEVLSRHQAFAESRGIKLSLRIGNKRMIRGNAVALEQVATNLIKNAVNYTPAHAENTVLVSIESDYRKRIVFAVIDSGIGIAHKDLYHIFEPYYRGDTSRARGIGTGTSGLGLAIVNEIVRLHKGTISVKSAVNVGTTIAVSFPPAPDTADLLPSPLMSDEDQEGMHEVAMDFS